MEGVRVKFATCIPTTFNKIDKRVSFEETSFKIPHWDMGAYVSISLGTFNFYTRKVKNRIYITVMI